MKWPMIALKDCAKIVGGATPKSDIPAYWGGDIAWATPKDLSDLDGKIITDTPRKLTDAGLKNCSSEVLPVNSVLLSSRAPIGHVAINSIPMATNQGFKSLIPEERLDASFLYWWLKCHRTKLESLGNGATFKEISKAVVERIEIPLPPLDEQKRIAAILDQADALRRLRKRSLDRLNTLSQAIFYEMFGDELCRNALPLSELIEEFRYGTSNKSGESGYPTLRIPNVVAGSIDLDDLKTVSVTQTEYNKLRLRPGDLLFVRTNGNPDNVGRCAVYEPEIVKSAGYEDDEFIYASYLIRARLNQYLINPKYLASYLTTSVGRRALREQSKTSAGQYNINTEGLGAISIPLPEIDRQNKFVERIELIKKHGIILQKENDKLDSLFASLQHRAFRGGL